MQNFNWHPTLEGKTIFDMAMSFLDENHRDVKGAMEFFYKASEKGDLAAKYNYATIYFIPSCSRHGTREKALKCLIDLIINKAPKADALFNEHFNEQSIDDLITVANSYFTNLEYEKAYYHYNAVYIITNGNNINAINRIIDCCYEIGKNDDAFSMHEQLIAKSIYDRICEYARIRLDHKDYNKAESLAKLAIENGYTIDGYRLLADLYRNKGDLVRRRDYITQLADMGDFAAIRELHPPISCRTYSSNSDSSSGDTGWKDTSSYYDYIKDILS